MKEYKIKCPHCKEEMIIKVDNEKIIEISHNDKKINISEIPNSNIEFG
jgi:hypothetical protein